MKIYTLTLIILLIKISHASVEFWSPLVRCPNDNYAKGLRVNFDPYDGGRLSNKDDVAVAGLEFLCTTSPENISNIIPITSQVYVNISSWTDIFLCPGKTFITGIQIKTVKERIFFKKDSLGVTTIVIFCNHAIQKELGLKQRRSMTFVEHNPIHCQDGFAISEFRTMGMVWRSRRQNIFAKVDNVGLTDFNASCKPLPIENLDCEAFDKWEKIFEFNNSMENSVAKLKYTKRTGLNIFKSQKNSDRSLNTKSSNSELSITFPIKLLKAKFKVGISKSKTTGYNWESTTETLWNQYNEVKVEISVLPGDMLAIHQVVGVCGNISTFVDKYQVETVSVKGNPQNLELNYIENIFTMRIIWPVFVIFVIFFIFIFILGKNLKDNSKRGLKASHSTSKKLLDTI